MRLGAEGALMSMLLALVPWTAIGLLALVRWLALVAARSDRHYRTSEWDELRHNRLHDVAPH